MIAAAVILSVAALALVAHDARAEARHRARHISRSALRRLNGGEQ